MKRKTRQICKCVVQKAYKIKQMVHKKYKVYYSNVWYKKHKSHAKQQQYKVLDRDVQMCTIQKGYKNHANQWFVTEVFNNILQKAYTTQHASDVILVTSDYGCNPVIKCKPSSGNCVLSWD